MLGRAVPSALSRLSQQKAGGKKQTETNLSKLPVSQLPGCEAAALPPGKTAQRPGTRCGASGGWGARGSEAPGDPAAPSQGVTRKGGAGGAGTRAAPPPPPHYNSRGALRARHAPAPGRAERSSVRSSLAEPHRDGPRAAAMQVRRAEPS